MTDKDVIKALEIESTPMERNCVRATYKEDCLGFYCTKTGKLAENCMECKEHTMDWRGRHSKATLDLINRQQAEIERLRNQCFKFSSLVERAFALCDDKDKQLETLFEVIERWKKICKNERFLAYIEFARELKISSFLLTHKKIDRILKRMVGEQK